MSNTQRASDDNDTLQITSFLLSNLHCPSCVSNIEDALSILRPKPSSISPSLVTSWVTIRHEPGLSTSSIRNALEDAGFEVRSIFMGNLPQEIPECHQDGSSSQTVSSAAVGSHPANQWTSGLKRKTSSKHLKMRERHMISCVLCQDEELAATQKKGSPSTWHHEAKPVDPSGIVGYGTEKATEAGFSSSMPANLDPVHIRYEGLSVMEREKADSSLTVIDDGEDTDHWKASLAVGGMTCASCTTAIREEMEDKNWIRKVDVNLIMNSAIVEFVGKHHAAEIVESIENIGYEATLDSIVSLEQPREQDLVKTKSITDGNQLNTPTRTVDIKIAGMFCPHCPERIIGSLGKFKDTVHVDKCLSLKDPILKIRYTPHAPDFTIRNIIEAMAEADSALVPSIYHPPTLEERSRLLHSQERRAITRRVALCVLVAIPTFVIGIVFMSLVSSTNGLRKYLESQWSPGVSRAQWALFIMATPVYFLAADIFHVRTIREVRAVWRRGSRVPLFQRFYRFGSMDMLISLGTSVAYISSVAQIIASSLHRSDTMNSGSFYFDSVVFLTMFLLIGRLIERYSKSKTGKTIGMLGKLRPAKAILTDGDDTSSHNIDVDFLEFGDIVIVSHGASPPNDGTITEGDALFDESSLTGESKPVKKAMGDQVYSGTINKGGPIRVRITGIAGTSMIDHIIEVVREGQTHHASIERIADMLTGYFVPLITLIAICTWFVWLGLGLSNSLPTSYLDSSLEGWAAWSLQFAIAVFVVACPCGLGLAAPTAIFVGGGLAAKYGILVKGGGEAFEKASRLDCIVFDKTGTLTVGGEPVVTDHKIFSGQTSLVSSEEDIEILDMIRKMEENSSHPIAKAIALFCNNQNSRGGEVRDVTETAGKGMSGLFVSQTSGDQTELIVGNETLMNDHSVGLTSEISEMLKLWKNQAKSIALVATRPYQSEDGYKLSAAFGISDSIRPEAVDTIKALKSRGTAVWMLSGDNYDSACAIGAQVGILSENIIAGVLPSQKAEKIQYLQKSLKAKNERGEELVHRRALVGMVGDGINDSPALNAADVGIAIGSGSDIAISSAEFVLVSSNLNSLIILLDLSRMVFNRIKFNFGWALVYNLIGVPIAAGVLYPIMSNGSHIRLDPVWASLAMALSSISVVCSSLALRSSIPGIGFKNRRN